jgi:hypothetical protein
MEGSRLFKEDGDNESTVKDETSTHSRSLRRTR